MPKEHSQSTIKFYWISSYIGIRGNDKAGELAKSVTVDEPVITKMNFTDLLEKFKRNAMLQTEYFIENRGKKTGNEYFNKITLVS